MRRIALEDPEGRRASSRGLIPKAKVKTVKMTCVIILGRCLTVFTNIYPFLLPQCSSCAGHLTSCLTCCRLVWICSHNVNSSI